MNVFDNAGGYISLAIMVIGLFMPFLPKVNNSGGNAIAQTNPLVSQESTTNSQTNSSSKKPSITSTQTTTPVSKPATPNNQTVSPASKPTTDSKAEKTETTPSNNIHFTNNKTQPNLRLKITVDNPSQLLVKEGDQVKVNQAISDNQVERNRLEKQLAMIKLRIKNINETPIPSPSPLELALDVKPLPEKNFKLEEAAIAQAKLKLQQAKFILGSQAKLLNGDNPERRAEVEKAEAELRLANEKVLEQEQLLAAMRDMQLEKAIFSHEEAKLKSLIGGLEQAKSNLEQQKGKLSASAIEQKQKLQQLQLNVQLAASELGIAQSKMSKAVEQRQLLEYQASLDAARKTQEQNTNLQNLGKQEQEYAQQIQNKKYQLAQLELSQSAIEDKISLIPVIRSPRDGYIRRIKNWEGNNGKYTTVVTISSMPTSKSNSSTNNSTNSN